MTEKQFAVFLFCNYTKKIRPVGNGEAEITFTSMPHRVRDEVFLRSQKAGLPLKEYMKHLTEVFIDKGQ